MNPIFQNMLSRYSMRTKDERSNAAHEVMQQIALAGLYKAGFFNLHKNLDDKVEQKIKNVIY